MGRNPRGAAQDALQGNRGGLPLFPRAGFIALACQSEWKQQILKYMPELPLEKLSRFVREYHLPDYDADVLTGERSLSEYFEQCVKLYGGEPKKVSNWLMNDVLRMINELNVRAGDLKLTPQYLADLIKQIDDGIINVNTAKDLLPKIQEIGESPAELVKKLGLAKISDDQSIRRVCEQVIAENPNETAGYKNGKLGLMGWFTGQVMKKMGGKADASIARKILEELLK